jgi:hypothetical protein
MAGALRDDRCPSSAGHQRFHETPARPTKWCIRGQIGRCSGRDERCEASVDAADLFHYNSIGAKSLDVREPRVAGCEVDTRAKRLGMIGGHMRGLGQLSARFARWDESEGALGRHSVLLASLVVLLVALPLGNVLSGGDTSFSILLAVVLMAAVFVNTPQRWSFVTATIIGFGAIAGLASAAVTGALALRIMADALSLGLLGFTTLLMLNSLLLARRVSVDTVIGGICVYLLMGLVFAMMFGLICDVEPGSIVEGVPPIAITRAMSDESSHATKLLYYSFVTMTTLGYGDITPRSELAQMMAVAEAVIGQLYLAIFVARLVALYVAEDRRHPRLRPSPPPDD